MRLPLIQAESTQARIGITSQPGQYDIRTRQPELQIDTEPARVTAQNGKTELILDQDKMWEAFNGGKLEAFRQRIYSQMPDILLQGIARIVENGNQLGDLRIKTNPIPDQAWEAMTEGPPPIEYLGPATAHNVDIHVDITPPDIQVEPGKVDVQARTQAPDIRYNRGNVNIYMAQYPSVSFQVSNLDQKI